MPAHVHSPYSELLLFDLQNFTAEAVSVLLSISGAEVTGLIVGFNSFAATGRNSKPGFRLTEFQFRQLLFRQIATKHFVDQNHMQYHSTASLPNEGSLTRLEHLCDKSP